MQRLTASSGELDGHVLLPDVPGIGIEAKAGLYALMRTLTAWAVMTAKPKLIIEARINEYMMRGHNSHVPWTPEEIADAAAGAHTAGAAIVHWHARHADGSPCHDAAVYARTIRLIRERCDILVHPTLGQALLSGAAIRPSTAVRRRSMKSCVVCDCRGGKG
jgi:hypothetical protein